jgi:hypothetical protein
MNRDELLERISEICYNSEDVFTFDEWSSMTVEQLRTVVALLANGGAEQIIDKQAIYRGEKLGHCYLLEGLVLYAQNPNAVNPHTNRLLTQRQRRLIEDADRRRRSPFVVPAAANVPYAPEDELEYVTLGGGHYRRTHDGTAQTPFYREGERDLYVLRGAPSPGGTTIRPPYRYERRSYHPLRSRAPAKKTKSKASIAPAARRFRRRGDPPSSKSKRR